MDVRGPDLWKNIVQSERDPICAFDTEFRLIGFNRAHSDEFFRIYGYRVQIGDVFPDLFQPEQAPVIRGFMARALAGESFNVTEEFGDPDLFKPYWDIQYTPLRNEQGEIVGAFHHAKDISARLRAEADLAAAQNTLRQSQKMEAVGQLTGGVAHDFNNLLTVILSSVEMLQRPSVTEERRTRYVNAIGDAVERAAKLTQQLLAFARRQALRPVIFDVGENVRRITEMLQTLVGPRVALEIEGSETPLHASADTSQFDTALVNMAVNARDAMDGEGTLTIRVGRAEVMPGLYGRPATRGDFVTVSVEDNGTGIAPHLIDKVFEPFFTTKPLGSGTGLGLSQVFGFAQQSNGEIDVKSEEGRGSLFTLYLPRAEPVAAQAAADAPRPMHEQGSARVLVVEDNRNVGNSTVDALTEMGFDAELAANGKDGLIVLAENPHRFDVVFSDVVMPGMTGLEMGREIRKRHAGLPVVLASGYSHVLAEQGTEGFELIQKPYSIEEVARVLRRTAEQRLRA